VFLYTQIESYDNDSKRAVLTVIFLRSLTNFLLVAKKEEVLLFFENAANNTNGQRVEGHRNFLCIVCSCLWNRSSPAREHFTCLN
jgi:hypothetical protein